MRLKSLLATAALLGLGAPAVAADDPCTECGDPHYSQAFSMPGGAYLCSPFLCFGGTCCQIIPFPE